VTAGTRRAVFNRTRRLLHGAPESGEAGRIGLDRGTTPLRQLKPRAARQFPSTHPKPTVASAATLMHGE
jgi:hypothetical protein